MTSRAAQRSAGRASSLRVTPEKAKRDFTAKDAKGAKEKQKKKNKKQDYKIFGHFRKGALCLLFLCFSFAPFASFAVDTCFYGFAGGGFCPIGFAGVCSGARGVITGGAPGGRLSKYSLF